MILNRKNPNLGPGFGTMYTVSVELVGCFFTESDNWMAELRVNSKR
jgi:hypothetical protein